MSRYLTNGEIVDILEGDNEALLFLDQTLIRASFITVDVLWMCQEARTFDELHHYLVDAFGAPPGQDPEATTRGVLEQLVEQGILKEVA